MHTPIFKFLFWLSLSFSLHKMLWGEGVVVQGTFKLEYSWTQQFLKIDEIKSGESVIYSVIISPLRSPHSSQSFTINCCVGSKGFRLLLPLSGFGVCNSGLGLLNPWLWGCLLIFAVPMLRLFYLYFPFTYQVLISNIFCTHTKAVFL